MKHKYLLNGITVITIMTILFACSSGKSTDESEFSKLAVTWKLQENSPDGKCRAEFSFTNIGQVTVKSGDWALYFNQNTLRMAEMPDANIGVVEHVNGDLYRFLPGNDFLLKPGDSVTVRYSYKGFLIKESDAPAGAYYVLNQGK